MHIVVLVLLIAALVVFLIATSGKVNTTINLVALGLALWVTTALIDAIGAGV